MIPGGLLSAFPHRQFHTLPGLLDSWAALPNSYPNALRAMQGGSLYHFYDGLWYDPCSSGTLTNVLPHRNAMPQTQDMTPHPVTVYRQRANLSLCYPSMWNVTLEYTATHFNVLGETRP